MSAAIFNDKIYVFGGAGQGGPVPNGGGPGISPPNMPVNAQGDTSHRPLPGMGPGGPQGNSSSSPIEVFSLDK